MMVEIYNIVMALINQLPWLAAIYTVHEVYKSRPKRTSIKWSDQLSIESER